MKAFALSSFDEPAAVTEVPDPIVQAGEVLVRVTAASLNPYDAFVASGAAQRSMTYELPAVLGGDHAGTVEALGDGVEGFAVGDRVFGMMGMKGAIHDGTFGELAVPQAVAVARTPEGVSDVDASALGVAGTTAVEAVEVVQPAEGQRVLIVGATGGVGSFAIQLARLRGAYVIATGAARRRGLHHRPGRVRDGRLHGRRTGRDPRTVPGGGRRGDRRRER
jgi:NADPH:quinone reductase